MAAFRRTDWPRVADVSSVVGGGVWLGLVGLVWTGRASVVAEPHVVLAVALAMLVLVPLLARLADLPFADGSRSWWYGVAVALQFPAAALAVVSLARPAGMITAALALPWFAVTGALAMFGLGRFLPRGLRPLSEVAVSAGLVYLPVGGMALVLHRLGVSFVFSPLLILLTVVHFHYAGAVLPVVAGCAGRIASARPARAYRGALAVILVGPGLLAIGITFSPLVEVAAALAFTAAVVVVAGYVLVVVVPRLDTVVQRILIGTASVAITVSMGFAVGYAASQYAATSWVTIPEMLRSHGLLNAIGFGLFGTVGVRLVAPESKWGSLRLPLSRLTSRGRVGVDFVERTDVDERGRATGMVDTFDIFSRPGFDASRVHSTVRDFYERTAAFDLTIRPRWQPGFHTVARTYKWLAARIEQMNFPLAARDPARLSSRIVPIDDAADGRAGVRAWIRAFEDTDAAIYVAAYATYAVDGESYMNIAFPLPFTNLTSVLRIEHFPPDGDATGVRLTTRSNQREAGVYLRTPLGPLRLPVNETIRVWTPDMDVDDSIGGNPDADALARHDMWLLGRRFLTLEYELYSTAD